MAWTADLLKTILNSKADFVLIGGVASLVHGAMAGTDDVDVCASMAPENVRAIVVALMPFHPKFRVRPDMLSLEGPDDRRLIGAKNMYFRTDIGQLDVLGNIPNVCTFEEAKARSIEIHFLGLRLPVIDVETLIAAKRVAGRPKDFQVIHELEAAKIEREGNPGLFDNFG